MYISKIKQHKHIDIRNMCVCIHVFSHIIGNNTSLWSTCYRGLKLNKIFSGWQGLSAWYSSPSRLERSSRPRHHRQRHRRLYCRMHQITATTMTLVYLPSEALHWCQKMCNYWICQFNYCRQNRKAGRAQKVRKTWQLGPEKNNLPSLCQKVFSRAKRQLK